MLGDNAIWIGTGAGADSDDAPLLRRAFTVHGDNRVARATLEITGLGYYEAWINGQRVGDHVLDPAQTDYEQRVLYVSYDVTALVQTDANTIGVMLGNGWYNQRLLWLEQCESTYGAPCLLAELHIEFADGSTEVRLRETTCTPAKTTTPASSKPGGRVQISTTLAGIQRTL
jgi:alpha-L-rhamnosidase